jgi:hypothetical protein
VLNAGDAGVFIREFRGAVTVAGLALALLEVLLSKLRTAFLPHLKILKCPVGSLPRIGSPKQYRYELAPPFPSGLRLSGLLNLIKTGLNALYPFPSR